MCVSFAVTIQNLWSRLPLVSSHSVSCTVSMPSLPLESGSCSTHRVSGTCHLQHLPEVTPIHRVKEECAV